MPTRLLASYEASLVDAGLIELRSELALTDARITELLNGLTRGESGRWWTDLQDKRTQLLAARQANDAATMSERFNEILVLIEQGGRDYAVWREIYEAIDLRRRLAETERRRLVDLQQMMTAEQALALVTALGATIRRYVTDPVALTAIAEELIRAVNRGAGADTESAGGSGAID